MGILGTPTPLGKAEGVADVLVHQLRQRADVRFAIVAGSVRRRKETVSDVDILIETYEGSLSSVSPLTDVHWTDKSGVAVINNVRVEFFQSPENCAGATLQFLTGPGDLNVFLRMKAKRNGMKLSQYGLWLDEDRIDYDTGSPEEDEYQIFDALGVPRLTPEERSEWRSYL